MGGAMAPGWGQDVTWPASEEQSERAAARSHGRANGRRGQDLTCYDRGTNREPISQ